MRGSRGEICVWPPSSKGERTPSTRGTDFSRVSTSSIAALDEVLVTGVGALNTTNAVSPARAGKRWSRRSNAFCESLAGKWNDWLNSPASVPPSTDITTKPTTHPMRTRQRWR